MRIAPKDNASSSPKLTSCEGTVKDEACVEVPGVPHNVIEPIEEDGTEEDDSIIVGNTKI